MIHSGLACTPKPRLHPQTLARTANPSLQHQTLTCSPHKPSWQHPKTREPQNPASWPRESQKAGEGPGWLSAPRGHPRLGRGVLAAGPSGCWPLSHLLGDLVSGCVYWRPWTPRTVCLHLQPRPWYLSAGPSLFLPGACRCPGNGVAWVRVAGRGEDSTLQAHRRERAGVGVRRGSPRNCCHPAKNTQQKRKHQEGLPWPRGLLCLGGHSAWGPLCLGATLTQRGVHSPQGGLEVKTRSPGDRASAGGGDNAWGGQQQRTRAPGRGTRGQGAPGRPCAQQS